MSILPWISRRTLLYIIILMLCVSVGWFALRIAKARDQARVVDIIRKHGGLVVYRHQFTGSPSRFTIQQEATPPGPAWLNQLLGKDFFCRPVYVNLRSTTIRDEDLAELSGLTELYILDLSWTRIGDAGLESIENLRGLRSLNTIGAQVTSEGLKRFKQANPQCTVR